MSPVDELRFHALHEFRPRHADSISLAASGVSIWRRTEDLLLELLLLLRPGNIILLGTLHFRVCAF